MNNIQIYQQNPISPYFINQQTNGQIDRLIILKEFLKGSSLSNFTQSILQQQPNSLYSEIILLLYLKKEIVQDLAKNYLMRSDPDEFPYQLFWHLQNPSQKQPLIQLIFNTNHQLFQKQSLDIVLKSYVTKQEVQKLQINLNDDIEEYDLQQIIKTYPKLHLLISFYQRKNPKFELLGDTDSNLITAVIKRSLSYNKCIEIFLNYLLECDDKQKIVDVLTLLNIQNDTVLNLGILNSTDEIQSREEYLFFEKWTQTKSYKEKIWVRFTTLVNQKMITLENSEFTVCNLNFSQPLLIKALFSLVKRHTSNFIIDNVTNQELKQKSHLFLSYPEFFKFFFIDYSQLLDPNYNLLILDSLNVLLTHIERTSKIHMVQHLKLLLCQFLVQCIQKMPDQQKIEINIYQFIQQILAKEKHMNFQFAATLQIDQIEKAIKNLDCLHLLLSDLDQLQIRLQNKEKFFIFCQCLKQKYKTDQLDKYLEIYQTEKQQKQKLNTLTIMQKKEEKIMTQIY